MNQILYTQKYKKAGNGFSVEFNKVALILTIIILLFAIFMIGKGVLGMANNSKEAQAQDPEVSYREASDKLELRITHNKAIDKIIYFWNDESQNTLQGMGRNEIEESIELPVGNNVLHLEISDIDNHVVIYTKPFYVSEDIDNIKPDIELIAEGSKAKIVVKDNKEIDSVSYKWNDEDETILKPRTDAKNIVEERISILKGDNTLTVVAKDAAGNETTKTQVYRGAKKPTITLTKENDQVVIKVLDEENVKKLDMNIDGAEYSTDNENTGASLDMKDVEIRQVLTPGEHVITVTAYNVSGLSEQETQTITI